MRLRQAFLILIISFSAMTANSEPKGAQDESNMILIEANMILIEATRRLDETPANAPNRRTTLSDVKSNKMILKHERKRILPIGVYLSINKSYCPGFSDINTSIADIANLVDAVNILDQRITPRSERADNVVTLRSDYKSLLEVCKNEDHEAIITSDIDAYKELHRKVDNTVYTTRMGGKTAAANQN